MVSQVVVSLGDNAGGLVKDAMPALLKALTNSKKVVVTFADNAMLSVLKACNASIFLGELISSTSDKNAALREKCYGYLQICLANYEAEAMEEPKMMLEEILRVVKAGISDSKGEVRDAAFSCLLTIESKFPARHLSLVESLDASSSKTLAVLKAKRR